MFRFLSFFTKLIIPILILVFSISTMLGEANLHKEILRSDNFYSKVAKEIKKNIFVLNDTFLSKIDIYLSRDVANTDSLIIKRISDDVDGKKIELVVKDTIEKQIIDVQETLNKGKLTNDNSIQGIIQNLFVYIYSYRMLILFLIVSLLLLVLLTAIFTSNKTFKLIANYFKGSSKNLAFLGGISYLSLTGFAFAGQLTKNLAKNVLGIEKINIELIDLINWQWVKFVSFLFIPAIIFLGIFLLMWLIFTFLSFFQRDTKQMQQVKEKIENLSSQNEPKNTSKNFSETKPISNNLPIQESSFKESFKETKSSEFRPVSNTPFPIPEPKEREDLDPFLDRLSNSIGDKPSQPESSNTIKIK
jgi:hypothetical protein